MLFNLFPHPRRLRLLRPLVALYQRSGLQSLMRKSGVLKALPRRFQALDTLLPRIDTQEEIPALTLPLGLKRARVGLILGCVQREFLSDVNAATVRVLAAEGCEVVAPSEQPCCGALLVHAGEADP